MTDPPTIPADGPGERDGDTSREDRLERRLDTFTQYAAVFVHDLRTPVSVASGRVQLARDDSAEETEAHLESAAEALQQVGGILDEWSALLHSDGPRSWDVVELETALQSTWAKLDTERADLLMEGSSAIRADEAALGRLVTNLVANAIRHGGPTVTVRAGTIDDEGFYVEDDGPGIPPRERDVVFDAGYSTGGVGQGLGLTSVELVAVAHGWNVSVGAANDGGARFEVRGVEVL